VVDLSIGSPLVNFSDKIKNIPTISIQQHPYWRTLNKKSAIGRYKEARLISTNPYITTRTKFPGEYRTIHLGMDVFVEPGTKICLPIEGIVHAISHQPDSFGNVPVVIIAHKTERGDDFFTLYKYLSLESLSELQIGQVLQKGQSVGYTGRYANYGDWLPHLHFQLICDLLDLGAGFPGNCQASHEEVWSKFSIDPNLILKIPGHIFPVKPLQKSETIEKRRKHIGSNLSLAYRRPLKIERGWMQYLYDETGRKYIDAYNNVPHVGHCHPRVVEAGRYQMNVLNTNTRYLHDVVTEYAEKILATLPDPLEVCFFVNSGSEANELALRLTRAYTQRKDMIVLEHAYHGNTTTMIDISPYKHATTGGFGAPNWVHTAPIPDIFRGCYKADDPKAAQKYAHHVEEIIQLLDDSDVGLAGFIAETCPGVGGLIYLPDGYLSQVYTSIRSAGGLCIADEVQTGYGRVGTRFYAFEDHGVVPDILVLGKPIGNGHPIGVVVTTREIAHAFDNGMEFFSTFGGNTVSCTIGKTVLEVVKEENLQANALEVGKHLINGLSRFKENYPIIGDVRGSGLFLGVELVRDRTTLEPATEEADFIINRMQEMGILLGTEGLFHNVIKIRPPMPFSINDADRLLNALDTILYEDFIV
jgi:4-aminobutyrate aminotransferase-like enzyme